MRFSCLSRFGKWVANWKFWDMQGVQRPAGAVNRPRRGRLQLEALEDRTLLSATVRGTVFEDFNANGVQNVNAIINNAAQGTVGIGQR